MANVKERLKHGKALCGKVFRRFVETFNWLVDFSSNLKGDGDDGGIGKITVDRQDEHHPVIRCKGCSSGGGGGGESTVDMTCFRFEDGKIVCCYYNIGGVTYHMDDFDVDSLDMDDEDDETVNFVCFKLTQTTPSIVVIDEDSLKSEQADVMNYIRPLYRYVGSTLSDDLRNAPDIQMVEYDEGTST